MSGAAMTAAGKGRGHSVLAWRPRIGAEWDRPTGRLTALLAALVVGAALSCAGVAYSVAQQSDARVAAEQRDALRGAIAEFRALFRDVDEIDPRFVRMVRQSVRLKSLAFDPAPPEGGREVQPVINGDGRIIGFFTWEPGQPMTDAIHRMMGWLFPAIMGFAALSGTLLWQLRRARKRLADSEAQARKAANEDKLTGLPNHGRVTELLESAAAARGEGSITFALIELDGVDLAAARTELRDGLIVSVSNRLKDVLPGDAAFGRAAPEKFALILTGEPESRAGEILRNAVAAVARPHWVETAVRVGAHAGFARAARDTANAEDLARRAEVALRAAAGKGPGTVASYDVEMDAAASERNFIRRELPRALHVNQLEVHYQPIVAANGGSIVGVEALLRWNHPSRGNIPPGVFIPVAEQMGLMDALGAFVLRRAANEGKRWSDIYIAVNLSPVQVRDGTIVALVRDVLAETGLAPSRLMLEITEGVLIDDPDQVVKRIQELRALGVRIALDDFGSGYSNLGYLQKFPFDKLKIDRSFVTALNRASNGGVIIHAMVALGRALGVSVLVEGVETEEQRVLLRLAGCDEMQGFLFARPDRAAAVDRLLTMPQARALPAPAKALTE